MPAAEARAPKAFLATLAALAATALAVLTYAYVTRWPINYSSDTAMIGLMAKSVLTRGELPIFVWSVGYQGVLLEVYPTALLFKLFGVDPVVLSVGPAVYTWLGLGLWTLVVARAFGWAAALTTALVAVVSTPLFFHMNLRTMPNFPEALLLGGALFLAVQREHPNGLIVGGIVGFALYTFAITAYFVLAAAVVAALVVYRGELQQGLKGFVISWLKPAGRLQAAPRWVRWPFATLTALGLVAVAVGLATISVRSGIEFRGRTVKWNPLATVITGAMLAIGPRVAYDVVTAVRRVAPWRAFATRFVIGFVVGHAPALLYKALGGTTSKRAFASGSLSDVANRFDILAVFHRELAHVDAPALPTPIAWVLAALYAAAIVAFVGFAWREARRFIVTGARDARDTVPFGVVIPIIITLFLVSRTVVDVNSRRYLVFLVPIYATAVGWAAVRCWSFRSWMRPIVVLGLAGFLWQGAAALHRDLETPVALPFAGILRELDARGLTHGYADYWLAYSTMFLADERVVLEPTYSNYGPHYGAPVRAASRIAYLDYTPPRIKTDEQTIEITGQAYRITERAELEGGVVLRVLER